MRQLSPTFGPAPCGGLQQRLHGPHFSRGSGCLLQERGARAPARRSSARALNRASSADSRNHGEGEQTNKNIYIYTYVFI